MTFKAAAVRVQIQADLECLALVSESVYCVLFLTKSFIILDLLIQEWGQWLSENVAVPLVRLLRCNL